MLILSILFFVTATLYSSVGFGGGSTYLALLLIWGVPYYIFPAIALLCNIFVVSGNCFNYIRAGNLNLKLLVPYLIGSVPLAFIGGSLEIDKSLFEVLLFFVLSAAGILLLFKFKSYDDIESNYKKIPFIVSLFIGSLLGLISGVVGIGGGIFLSPILFLLRAGKPQQIVTTASIFILINSISGIKPANLIATRSEAGEDNVAIFSSVIHLGSNPPQLGFIVRQQVNEPTHTFLNIKETGWYTINHITESLMEKAHYTSTQLPREESEFDAMQIEKEVLDQFPVPFVKDSPIKIGMSLIEIIPLPNGCSLVIGLVELILLDDHVINSLGQLNLSACHVVGISGLDTYYGLSKLETFPDARISKVREFS